MRKNYNVKLKGRSAIVYVEGDKRMIISSEFLSSPSGIVIYSDSIKKWEAPHEGTKITGQQKEEIKKNITSDLEMHGIRVEWA